jgi:hypothetical protein
MPDIDSDRFSAHVRSSGYWIVTSKMQCAVCDQVANVFAIGLPRNYERKGRGRRWTIT